MAITNRVPDTGVFKINRYRFGVQTPYPDEESIEQAVMMTYDLSTGNSDSIALDFSSIRSYIYSDALLTPSEGSGNTNACRSYPVPNVESLDVNESEPINDTPQVEVTAQFERATPYSMIVNIRYSIVDNHVVPDHDGNYDYNQTLEVGFGTTATALVGLIQVDTSKKQTVYGDIEVDSEGLAYRGFIDTKLDFTVLTTAWDGGAPELPTGWSSFGYEVIQNNRYFNGSIDWIRYTNEFNGQSQYIVTEDSTGHVGIAVLIGGTYQVTKLLSSTTVNKALYFDPNPSPSTPSTVANCWRLDVSGSYLTIGTQGTYTIYGDI